MGIHCKENGFSMKEKYSFFSFSLQDPASSFFVSNITEVNENVTRHLDTELDRYLKKNKCSLNVTINLIC